MKWRYTQTPLIGFGILLLAACQSPAPAPGLPAPTDFAATVGSASSIGLTWRKVEGASEYELELRAGTGSFSPLLRLPHQAGGPLFQSHTDSGLSPATRYTYRIRAVSATAQSPWSVSNELETPSAASTRYQVRGNWLGAMNPNLYLISDTGVAYSGATIWVNGVQLNFRNPPGSYYAPSIPGATEGTVLNLEITVPEGTITGNASLPSNPTLTAPVANARITANQPLNVTWEYTGPNPDRFYLHLVGNGPLNYIASNIPGDQHSHTVPAGSVVPPSMGRAFVFLYAVNDGKTTFSGPVLDTSEMGVAASSQVVFDIVP